MGKPWRWKSIEEMPAIEAPVDLDFISRLPQVQREDPKPLPMDQVILLIPGYDPHRDAGDCWFDAEAAEAAIDFVHECCTHVKGHLAGEALILDLWLQAIVANIFGWKRPDGTRRYRDVGIWVPRKNSKTTTIAAIVLKMLFADGEGGAEVYSAAAEREQAAIVYGIAKGMIANEPELDARAKIYTATKVIDYPEMGGTYKALSADAHTKHGYNPSCYVLDELHALKSRHLVDALETGVGTRLESLGIIITTAGFDGPHICNEKQDLFEKIRDGAVKDPASLPAIYAAPDPSSADFDPHDERTWRLANPNIEFSFPVEYIRRRSEQAKASPSFLNTFLRYHLNVRTQSSVAAINIADFDGCQSIDPRALKGKKCFAALDLASTQDLSSLTLWFPEAMAMLSWSWVPEETALARQQQDDVDYITWSEMPEERLTLTEGNVADYNRIYDDMTKIADTYDIQVCAYDPWNAHDLVQRLMAAGMSMVEWRQGYRTMSGPTKEWLRLVSGREVRHTHSQLMRWCCLNLMLKVDEHENKKPDKKASKNKIDPVVAWIMAVGAAASAPVVVSPYAKRGFRRL